MNWLTQHITGLNRTEHWVVRRTARIALALGFSAASAFFTWVARYLPVYENGTPEDDANVYIIFFVVLAVALYFLYDDYHNP